MALINCPECNAEISDKAIICPKCGFDLKNTNLLLKCEECGMELKDSDKSCPNCGCPTNIKIVEIKDNAIHNRETENISNDNNKKKKGGKKWVVFSVIGLTILALIILLPLYGSPWVEEIEGNWNYLYMTEDGIVVNEGGNSNFEVASDAKWWWTIQGTIMAEGKITKTVVDDSSGQHKSNYTLKFSGGGKGSLKYIESEDRLYFSPSESLDESNMIVFERSIS